MSTLSTRNSRRNLPRSRTIQWTKLARGRALGYRRPDAEAGTWYVRSYFDGAYRTAALGRTDDKVASDGVEVLSYAEAVELALGWKPGIEVGPTEPLTVAKAVEHYLDWYKDHRKSYGRIQSVFRAHVLPELGKLEVDALTPLQLRRWHQAVAEKPAILRGGQIRETVGEDAQRARKVTANHALVALKAALNRALEDGLCASPGAWSRVKAFRGVDTARVRYLESEEIKRLLNVATAGLRDLLVAALHTGARYDELAQLFVGDYMPEAAAVHLTKTKSNAPRTVFLSDEGVAFFDRLTAGKQPSERLLRKADGSTWKRNHQSRRMKAACAAAGIDPPVGFHQLRHTYASHYLMNGGSLVALAKQLGHSTTRMVEKHYGHLADAWRAEEARKHAPQIGSERSTVVRMRRKTKAG